MVLLFFFFFFLSFSFSFCPASCHFFFPYFLTPLPCYHTFSLAFSLFSAMVALFALSLLSSVGDALFFLFLSLCFGCLSAGMYSSFAVFALSSILLLTSKLLVVYFFVFVVRGY